MNIIFSAAMKTCIVIVFMLVFIVFNQIGAVNVIAEPRGVMYKEQLEDYDVKKKVILTPVQKMLFMPGLGCVLLATL